MPRTASPTPATGPRILVCGWAGAGNIGDELLTRATVDVLRAAGARVTVASRDPVSTRALHPGVEAVPWGPRGLARAAAFDGVCVGPGGIVQDGSSLWSLPGHVAMPAWARARGAVVVAVGVGAEPLHRRSSAWMLRRVLGDTVAVTRDDASTAALRAAGIEAETSIDLVFGLTVPEVERTDEIVVAVGPATRPGRIAPAGRRVVPAATAEIAAAIDALAARSGCRVALACFRGGRDRAAAAAIGAALTADHEILGPGVDAHVRRVAGARLVVASRYHPIVLAALAATPALVVSDQAKVQSLADQIGAPAAVRVASWAEVATHGPVPVLDAPHVPPGLGVAHDALRALVRDAGEARASRRGG